MQRVLLFLQKLVTLILLSLVLFISLEYIPFYYTLPVLMLVFGLLVWRITGDKPKELYNYNRSEKYFSKGGLRDLVKIPVTLVAVIHDTAVWIIWGTFQLIVLFADFIYFIKELFFGLIQGIIWFLKQLFPFWRLLFRLFLFYCLKWPWWIYRYAFQSIRKTYNWNVIKVSTLGSFFALLILQLFYFLDTILRIEGLVYVGIILSVLPVSWIFGEIASIRGQKLMHVSFREVRNNFRNGIETIRSLLFFLTLFIALLLLQTGLDFLGWIPKSGIMLLGICLNVNFFINIILVFLAIIIVFGSFIIPSYRLYKEFNESSIRNNISLLSYIFRRILQFLSGFVPSSFFATISLVFPAILVAIALGLTIELEQGIFKRNINHLNYKLQESSDLTEQQKINEQLEYQQYLLILPKNIIKEVENRQLIQNEITDSKNSLKDEQQDLTRLSEENKLKQNFLEQKKSNEQKKPVINQTRIDEITDSLKVLNLEIKQIESLKLDKINNAKSKLNLALRKYNQLPVIFYLSGLFMVFVLTLVFAFLWGFYGNFFYSAFVFRNDDTPAMWKEFIKDEKLLDGKQPLLSITLNILIILTILVIFLWEKTSDLFTFSAY
jgi:hypothetical protein